MTSVNITQVTNTVTVTENGAIVVVPVPQTTVVTATAVGPQGPVGASGAIGPTGPGVPAGGATGDILVKTSATNYATAWTDAPTVDLLGFDLTAAEAVGSGQLSWDGEDQTLHLGLPGGVTAHLNQETMLLCRNNSNTVAIPKGTAVRFAGSIGNSGRLKVAPMVADGTYPGYVVLGVTDQVIAGGADGYVTVFGKIRGINTSAYQDGDILWCDPAVAGGFTTTEPAAPNLKLPIAAVINAANNGSIFVRWTTGNRLKDLHDVEVTGGALDTQYLGWSETYQHWKPYSIPNAAPRSITIAGPQIGDSFTLFRTSGATTIASAVALVSGGSVTYELRYAADRTTAGTLATLSDTVTNTTTGDTATIQNQPIPSGRYVWVEITAVTGTVNELNLSVAF